MAGAVFPTSTHFKHWQFTPEVLSALRDETNRKSFAHITNGASGGENAVPLTVPEEALLRRHNEFKILEICRKLSYREEVQATAIAYFKRFYLYNTATEHDMTHIMLTCIFLACKSEEAHVSIDDFVSPLKLPPTVVLGNELLVLEAIKFHLMVFHSLKPLHGFFVDLVEQVAATNTTTPLSINAQRLKNDEALRTKIQERSLQLVMGTLTTDASLLLPPGPIALAALLLAANEHGLDLSDYISFRFPQTTAASPPALPNPSILKLLDRIRPFLSEGQLPPPNTEDVKRIDRQLRFCRNPELIERKKKEQAEEKERIREKKLKLRAEKEREDLARLTGMGDAGEGGGGEFKIHSAKRRREL